MELRKWSNRPDAMSRGFSQTGFNPLQRLDAFAFQVALARPRQNRFGEKAMLHAKSLLDGFLQELVFSHCHVGKITNESPNRKSILVEIKTARIFRSTPFPSSSAGGLELLFG